MKTLIAPRAIKGIDQVEMAATPNGVYIPIENMRTWTGGPIVDPDTSLNFITVLQCVRILSETFASLPLMVYRKRADGGRTLAQDHPLYRTLHDQPNPDMTSFVWRLLLMTHLKTWGNAFNEVVRLGDGSIELYPIRPERMEVSWGADGRRVYDYLSLSGGKRRMRPGSVFHVQDLSSNGLIGLSPITMMRTTLQLAQNAERYGRSVFDNGARPAIVVEHPMTLSDGAVGRLGAQMDELRGAGNAGKSVILEEGSKVHEIGFPPEDAQFMETRLFQKREIAAQFRIPAGMVGDPERGEEKEDEEARKFIKGGMVPNLENFEQESSRQLLEDDDVYVEFSADGYLRGDPKARADAFAVRWEHGNLNGDEWRKKENEDPLPDDLGKTYYRPANWVPLGDEPVPVGGDASTDTQFGAGAGIAEQLTRAKSAEVRCPECNRKLAELAAPPYRIVCARCKGVAEVAA